MVNDSYVPMTVRLQDAILDYIIAQNEIAISTLYKVLRKDGWGGLGNLTRFRWELEDTGFVLRKRPRGLYVSL